MSDLHGTTLDNSQFFKLSQLSLSSMKQIYENNSANWNIKCPCTSLLFPHSSHLELWSTLGTCAGLPRAANLSLLSAVTSTS